MIAQEIWIIVLVIPFLAAWFWTNNFVFLIWDFYYDKEKWHTYTCSSYFVELLGKYFFLVLAV